MRFKNCGNQNYFGFLLYRQFISYTIMAVFTFLKDLEVSILKISYPVFSFLLKTQQNHLDYQLILVRNTCENASPKANPNSVASTTELPSRHYNARMISQLRSIEKSSVESTSAIPDLVIYNRVPKCGSTTMLQVLNHVQKENNFTIFNQIEPNLSVRHQNSRLHNL